MRHCQCSVLSIIAVLLAWGATSDLSRADQAGQRAADEATIRQATKDFVLAFNSGDSKAAAAFWTEEGDYVGDDGDAVRFRERIAGLSKQAAAVR